MAVPTLSGQFARHLLDLVAELASLSDFGIVEVLFQRLKRHLQQSSVYRTLQPRKSESRNQRLAEGGGGGFFESCAEGIRAERLSAGRRFSASLPINSELGQSCKSQHAKRRSQSIRHTTECRLR